ncbi:16S rRNA (uracil(1498)-N(3))-methyltransferase [Candidatus Gracilibacteria bacterium]|nr:16S rRNA (uracil(1498)-N(3))-methyltransferase [Candidatus Gracilibacteria bacterium]MCF7898790.1 16S rRNA (uracil(1498)-N(3))-methyltransferase [Candidatus Paceibacterota bacterium]
MRLHRFYVSQPLGEEVVIEDVSKIKQWIKVFRYSVGDFVILFNGDSNDYTYSIDSVSDKKCSLVLHKKLPSYIPSRKINLYLSVIKKDNFELVVQKATELGVTAIIPIISERSEKKNLNDDRLHKIAMEAGEQCGRGDIPTISPILSLSKALEVIPTADRSIFLQINGTPFNDKVLQEKIRSSSNLNLFIGPEGGWSDDEEILFSKYNISSVSLGNTVLRAETAAIATCSLFCL